MCLSVSQSPPLAALRNSDVRCSPLYVGAFTDSR